MRFQLQRVLLAAGLLVPTEAAMRRATQLMLLVPCRATLLQFDLDSFVRAFERETRAHHRLAATGARLLLVTASADS